MRPPRLFARLALTVLASCTLSGLAQAQAPAPAPDAVPPGWVWQGVWQDGRWDGQWIPGPGVPPGAPAPGAYPAPVAPPWDGGSDRRRMYDRCHDHHRDHDADMHTRDHDCEEFTRDYREFRSRPPVPQGAPVYGAMPYAPGAYAGMVPPPGYMMVPVITAPQAPCVETRTVTTEYVVDKPRRVVRARPHRKEKRVYTGS